MKRLLTIATVTTLLTLTSCTKIFSGLYGLKQPKTRATKKIQKFADKYNIPTNNSFVLDTSYLTFLHKLDTTQRGLAKNHFQPLQALYFDKTGQLVSYHINCYAGGFPNLQWDRDGLLDTFVPKSQTPVDTLLTFDKQLQFIRTFDNKTLNLTEYSKADNNVVIYWSIFMGRQSKRLIKYIKDNCDLAGGKSVNLLFVNNDNIYGLADE